MNLTGLLCSHVYLWILDMIDWFGRIRQWHQVCYIVTEPIILLHLIPSLSFPCYSKGEKEGDEFSPGDSAVLLLPGGLVPSVGRGGRIAGWSFVQLV